MSSIFFNYFKKYTQFKTYSSKGKQEITPIWPLKMRHNLAIIAKKFYISINRWYRYYLVYKYPYDRFLLINNLLISSLYGYKKPLHVHPLPSTGSNDFFFFAFLLGYTPKTFFSLCIYGLLQTARGKIDLLTVFNWL